MADDGLIFEWGLKWQTKTGSNFEWISNSDQFPHAICNTIQILAQNDQFYNGPTNHEVSDFLTLKGWYSDETRF